MNTFYLVRHGDKEKIKGDVKLTKKGISQALKTGLYLKDENIHIIFSSTYRRTRETSLYINKSLNCEIIFDKRLRERMNWGEIKNQTFEEFIKEWEYSNNNRDYKPTVGLSSLESSKNAIGLIVEINKKYKDKNILLITHGGVIGDILRSLFTVNELNKHKPNFVNELDKTIKVCSITKFSLNGITFELLELALTKHL